jgi:hypothetical protein
VECLFHNTGQLLSQDHAITYDVIRGMKHRLIVGLREDKAMSMVQWSIVEDNDEVLILIYFVAILLFVYDLTEYTIILTHR